MSKKLWPLLVLLLLPTSAGAQPTVFTPSCSGTDDTAEFSRVISMIGSNTAPIRLPYKAGTRCAVNSLTIPANVTLDNSDGTGLKVNAGQTLTMRGGIVGGNRRLFYGPGSVVLPSNNYAYEINPVWFSAGSGTLADPWTEWDTRVTWGGNTYRFPKGFYSYAVSPAFSHPGIRLYGQGAYLIYTGTGAAINFLSSSRAPGAHTFNAYMEGFIVQGLNASHGLHVQTTHHSVFRDIRVRNLPGVAFYFKSSNWDLLENLTSNDPVGDSIIGSTLPAVTVVPTRGLWFDDGAVFPGDATTNNAMTVVNINLSYIKGKGVVIESLISSAFIGGAVERCAEEGIVVGSGNVASTNSVSFTATEVEFNNGAGGDVYINAKSTSLINLQGFNALINIDAGAENTLLLGGVYDSIHILPNAKATTLLNLRYNYSGSGDISNGGQNTFTKNVIDGTTGAFYPDTLSGVPGTPTQLTANVNNWNPGRNLNVRASSDASRNVTGIANLQEDGQIMYLWNVGSQNIVLVNESASSTAANRLHTSTGADITLAANKCALLFYDGATQRWRVTLLP